MEGEDSVKAYIGSLRTLPLALTSYHNVTWGEGSKYPTLTSVRGVKYTPLWMALPWLEPFYTDFEKSKCAPNSVYLLARLSLPTP